MKVLLKVVIIMTAIISTQVKAEECVVLLHGLARSDSSMEKIASVLTEKGYNTVNYSYPSTKYGVETLAEHAISDALAQCPSGSKVHFVTHSMGGILVREYLHHNTIDNLGRVVMLGPPNKGSQIVDRLKHLAVYKSISGPAGMQLGTDGESLPYQLGGVNFELGIVAGTRSVNLMLSTLLPGQDDGKVSVENTKIDGMTDHISMPVTHPFMMKNNEVINQVLNFLQKGRFRH